MLRVRSYDFARDERGAGTIMGLLWFMLLVGITGLAVDATNGFRNRTMLQATADAAVLAAVIDLPNEAAAVTSAITNSTSNMPNAMYGDVLQLGDIEIGAWRMPGRRFEEGGLVVNILDPDGPLIPDAVRVTLHQTVANANAVPVNFLRIIGLRTWDVNVLAVAQRFLPECLNNGLVAAGMVDMSSNNHFSKRICIHGQRGVMESISNIHDIGVTVSTPSMYDDTIGIIVPAGKIEADEGLREAMREVSLVPRMVNRVDDIMLAMLDMESYVRPDYIGTTSTSGITLPRVETRQKGWDFADATAGNVYHIECEPMQTVRIPGGTILTGVVIISDCNIVVGPGVEMSDVVLASLSTGNPGGNDGDHGNPGGNGQGGNTSGQGGAGVEHANIVFSGKVVLGFADDCRDGGGVQIFSNASVQISSQAEINGLQIIAAGDVDLGTQGMGIKGINVQAGGNITLNSLNHFGICSGGVPNLQTVAYYRLTH